MPNGYGRGFGRGGWGFGFRGSSPPWPYVGLGRGGLPRCGYFLSGAAGMPVSPAYPSYDSPGAVPYGGTAYPEAMPYGYAGAPMGAVPGVDPYAPQMTREQELDFLRNQAGALESELDVIMKRLNELRK
jgi:hypothetical protein